MKCPRCGSRACVQQTTAESDHVIRVRRCSSADCNWSAQSIEILIPSTATFWQHSHPCLLPGAVKRGLAPDPHAYHSSFRNDQ